MAAVFPEPLREVFVARPRAALNEDAQRRARWRSADMMLPGCSDDGTDHPQFLERHALVIDISRDGFGVWVDFCGVWVISRADAGETKN